MKNKFFLIVPILAIVMAMPVMAIEFRQIYTIEKGTRNPFSLFSTKNEYIQGENAVFNGYIDLNADCVDFWAMADFKNAGGSVLASANRHFGQAGFATMYWEITQTTSGYSPGDYSMEVQWYCDSTVQTWVLGNDGAIDATANPDKKTFKILASGTTPPSPTCNKTCSPGYELVNPSSVDCFCSATYTDNGICEIGEPITNIDCKPNSCPDPNQQLVDGLCVEKRCSDSTLYNQCSAFTKPKYCAAGVLIDNSEVCGCPVGSTVEEGGKCSGNGFNLDATTLAIIFGAILLIAGGIIAVKGGK